MEKLVNAIFQAIGIMAVICAVILYILMQMDTWKSSSDSYKMLKKLIGKEGKDETG